jgi:hypothetical protein
MLIGGGSYESLVLSYEGERLVMVKRLDTFVMRITRISTDYETRAEMKNFVVRSSNLILKDLAQPFTSSFLSLDLTIKYLV